MESVGLDLSYWHHKAFLLYGWWLSSTTWNPL